MTTFSPILHPGRTAVLVCAAAMTALAVAMGVGRFAFTPLFPLMVRDGLLDSAAGAWLAAANYLGYLAGALTAARITLRPALLLATGLVATVVITAAAGWTTALPIWIVLRFLAGVVSAWTLVATGTWGLGWLAALGRPHLAGILFSGVGLGIAGAGLFCLLAAGPAPSSPAMWVGLAGLAGLASLLPLAVGWRLPVYMTAGQGAGTVRAAAPKGPHPTAGLVACYTLFGFGYILPATYLPALARQLVDDPQVFGLAWPLFGAAAALSTILVSWRLGRVNRLALWALSHLLMAAGVLLPIFWTALGGVVFAALLVGGTFMVITMVAMQEARARAETRVTQVLGQMTAGFAAGQLAGPLANALIAHFAANQAAALHLALGVSAAGLLASAVYLWRAYQRSHYLIDQ
jgi:MFS family permease